MAPETTITDEDLDPATRQFVHGMRQDLTDFEPDLAVDGLSESVVSRLFRLLGFRQN